MYAKACFWVVIRFRRLSEEQKTTYQCVERLVICSLTYYHDTVRTSSHLLSHNASGDLALRKNPTPP